MLICAPPLAAAQDRSAHRLLLIRAGSCGAEPDHAVLADLYGLGRSEAALAACIARGLSLIDAAHVLGLSVETVRNYSKRIFAKTGARGQADLVRILLGSVAVIQAGDGVDTIHAR
jgi:DNA-binding CsgD family transcriptional regulator